MNIKLGQQEIRCFRIFFSMWQETFLGHLVNNLQHESLRCTLNIGRAYTMRRNVTDSKKLTLTVKQTCALPILWKMYTAQVYWYILHIHTVYIFIFYQFFSQVQLFFLVKIVSCQLKNKCSYSQIWFKKLMSTWLPVHCLISWRNFKWIRRLTTELIRVCRFHLLRVNHAFIQRVNSYVTQNISSVDNASVAAIVFIHLNK